MLGGVEGAQEAPERSRCRRQLAAGECEPPLVERQGRGPVWALELPEQCLGVGERTLGRRPVPSRMAMVASV